jgi:ABC-type sugar transport system substrate-binding protein
MRAAINRERNVMLKAITVTAAMALSVTAWVLLPTYGHLALAQSGPFLINAVEYDVVPGQIDNFLAALKENAAASVKEPGCRELNIAVSQKDPNHVSLRSTTTPRPPKPIRRPITSRNTRQRRPA